MSYVTSGQAVICAEFILDNTDDTDPMPEALAEAVSNYERATAGGETADQAVVEEVREQIERWLLVDRDACVGLLGPGLGLDEDGHDGGYGT